MRNPKKSKREMTSIEVARILDMSPDDVAMYARKGILHGRKDGHQWRFTRRDVTYFSRKVMEKLESLS